MNRRNWSRDCQRDGNEQKKLFESLTERQERTEKKTFQETDRKGQTKLFKKLTERKGQKKLFKRPTDR